MSQRAGDAHTARLCRVYLVFPDWHASDAAVQREDGRRVVKGSLSCERRSGRGSSAASSAMSILSSYGREASRCACTAKSCWGRARRNLIMRSECSPDGGGLGTYGERGGGACMRPASFDERVGEHCTSGADDRCGADIERRARSNGKRPARLREWGATSRVPQSKPVRPRRQRER